MNPIDYFWQHACGSRMLVLKDEQKEFAGNALFGAVRSLSESLIQRGVFSGERIAVLCGKNASQVIAMLSVWNVGAVYVPISINNPQARVDVILRNCEISHVLVEDKSIAEEFKLSGMVVISVLAEIQHPAHEALQSPMIRAAPEDTSYIIYTSGSTGSPKGVVVANASLSCLIKSAQKHFNELGDSAVLLQVLDFSFDVSIWDVVLWLAKGSTLIVVDISHNIFKLVKMIVEYRPSYICNASPTYARLMSAQSMLESYNLDFVRTVITTASYCSPKVARYLLRTFPQARLYNCYGPTETTVYCCWTQVTQDSVKSDKPLSIGCPLPGLEAFLYDGNRLYPAASVDEDTEMELCIAGPHVFKEYWKAPELTVQKILLTTEGKRVYRTGDLVRQKDRKFYYCGRTDDTVKVKGYRVNLGEVELCLNTADFVENCIVLAKAANDDLHLIAYYTVKGGSVIAVGEETSCLQNICRQHLPPFMLPEQFIRLSEFPVNSAGKIDRVELRKQFQELSH